MDKMSLFLSKINLPFLLLISSPLDFWGTSFFPHRNAFSYIYKYASISSIFKQNKYSLTLHPSWLSHHISASLYFFKELSLVSFPTSSILHWKHYYQAQPHLPNNSSYISKKNLKLVCLQTISFFKLHKIVWSFASPPISLNRTSSTQFKTWFISFSHKPYAIHQHVLLAVLPEYILNPFTSLHFLSHQSDHHPSSFGLPQTASWQPPISTLASQCPFSSQHHGCVLKT